MIVFNHISSTFESLSNHKWRNFLTILGISIGSACIALVLTLSNGSKQILLKQLKDSDKNVILIKPINKSDDENLIKLDNINVSLPSTLSDKDIFKLKENKNLEAVLPISFFTSNIKSNKMLKNQKIIATNPDFIKLVNLKIDSGQFLQDGIIDNAAVIGKNLAEKLFGTEKATGSVINIKGKNFTIVGIIDSNNSTLANTDLNNTVIININPAKEITNNTTQIQQILVKSNNDADVNLVKNQIYDELNLLHNNESDFLVINKDNSEHPAGSLFETISKITLLIATISIVVGGVGVMNIMLVAVAERTQEIGVRKAIGAKTKDIILQFLTESIILCFTGGLLGLAIAFILSMFYKSFFTIPIIFNTDTMLIVLAISVIIGAISGFIPAIKAARKNPISAIKQF